MVLAQLRALARNAQHEAERAWREDRRGIYEEFQPATTRNADQLAGIFSADPEQRGNGGFSDTSSLSASVASCIFALSRLSLVASAEVYELALQLGAFVSKPRWMFSTAASHRNALRRSRTEFL